MATTDAQPPQSLMDRGLEWSGVVTAIIYSLLVASNTGLEFLGFGLLLASSFLIGFWAWRRSYRGIFLLQFFYASAAVIGLFRWG